MARAHQHLDQPISRKDLLLDATVATGSLVASPSLLTETTEEKRQLWQDDEITAEDLAR